MQIDRRYCVVLRVSDVQTIGVERESLWRVEFQRLARLSLWTGLERSDDVLYSHPVFTLELPDEDSVVAGVRDSYSLTIDGNLSRILEKRRIDSGLLRRKMSSTLPGSLR